MFNKILENFANKIETSERNYILSPPKNDQELKDAIKKLCNISIPDYACCPEHTSPFKAFANAYFVRDDNAVWKCARGSGKSALLAALAYMQALCLGADISVLGGSGQQSENVFKYINGAHTRMPKTFFQSPNAPKELLEKIIRTEMRLTNGGKLLVLTASQTSIRGQRCTTLLLDEVEDFTEQNFNSSLGLPMPTSKKKEQIVYSSTHHKDGGMMSDVLKRAKDGGWPVYSWCLYCCEKSEKNPDGWLTKEFIERKRATIPDHMWQTEYMLAEPSSKGRAILTDKVEEMFSLKAVRYLEGKYQEFEAPEPNGLYVTGADWAKQNDKTAIVTLRVDCEPAKLVASIIMNRLHWPYMVAQYDKQVKRYNSKACHDATGIGNVISDLITVKGVVDIFLQNTKLRTTILSNYIKAIENNEIIAPRLDYIYNEHKYATVQDLYGSGHLPDTICAMALAWHMKRRKVDFQVVHISF